MDDDDFDIFECYEGFFDEERKICIDCCEYKGCILEKILDLLTILGMEKEWEKINLLMKNK